MDFLSCGRISFYIGAGSYRTECYCLVTWWGIGTGESVPKGPKPLGTD